MPPFSNRAVVLLPAGCLQNPGRPAVREDPKLLVEHRDIEDTRTSPLNNMSIFMNKRKMMRFDPSFLLSFPKRGTECG